MQLQLMSQEFYQLKMININVLFGNFDEYSLISPKWMANYIGFNECEIEKLCEIQKDVIKK